jgi:hypothetical protein
MSEPTNARIRYEQPAIARRELVVGLLGTAAKSDTGGDVVFSDVTVKENIRPVRW